MAEKKLIIVESPTKAKTIKKFLGTDCTVIASNGHIMTLPKDDLCIDIKNGYKPKYVLDTGREKIVSQMKSELKTASELILATDEDREGESISWHIVEVLKPKVPYRRMVFHEITKKAIQEAIKGGRDIDTKLVSAQEARRILDRLYGYTISPVLWSKLSAKGLSAGRVQSPGLRLVVDKERTRLLFKKSEYWTVRAIFKEGFEAKIDSYDNLRVANNKDFDSETGAFTANDKVLLLDKEAAEKVVSSLDGGLYKVFEVKEKTIIQRPYPPFITSTLQQEGNRKLHLSTKDTMRVAQALYEQGFITYMRTDSPSLSQEGIKAAREAAASLFGKAFISEQSRQYSAKSAMAQEAHEAIRPAGEVFRKPEETGLTGRELALYDLIWKRTLASQMKDAVKLSTYVTIEASKGQHEAKFSANGIRIEFPGFLRVYVEGSDDPEAALEDKETMLPQLTEGQKLDNPELEEQGKETKAPNRYTEASLVQTLEKMGIGRPSTYASIIDRLFEKQYIVKENGSLTPTFTGFGVMQLLERYFGNRIDFNFTSEMENGLDQIANGELDELAFLKDFYEGPGGLENQVKENKAAIDGKTVKKIVLPQISEENCITMGPYGPYVKTEEGDFLSVPETWLPANITDEIVAEFRRNGKTEKTAQGPEVLYTFEDGQQLFRCTGRFGDYWQIGDKAKGKDVKRFTIPKKMLGQEVPIEKILQFFDLPRALGKDSKGEEVSADMGKYGPFVKAGSEFRSLGSIEEIFTVSLEEACDLLSKPKESKKSGGTKAGAIVDFGDYQGEKLGIFGGKYGYYLKHGKTNYRIAKEYQKDLEACQKMSMEMALTFLKK